MADVKLAIAENHLLVALGARLRAERERLGLSQERFADLIGVSKSTVKQQESGETALSARHFFRLRDQGVDIAALLTGSTPSSTFATSLRDSIQEAAARERDGLVEVEEIDLAYGMGASFVDGPVRSRTHLLPRQLLATITSASPSQLTIARGVGDSMQPTLQDGDMVLIDRSQRHVRDQDGIWALSVGEIAMIKRLRVRPGRVQLLSDNDRVPPDEALPDEINIVGRVVFIGRNV